MTPSVSVVVPNFNGGELFRGCVRSLARLEYEGGLEVCVVDDGSTDGSGEWLQSEPLPDFVQAHAEPQNRGRSAARNTGLQAATGEIVVFLDGDLTVEPDFVQRHVEALAQPGVHAVVGRVTAAPEARHNRVARYLHEYPGRGARQFAGRPVPPRFVVTNNLALRRELLDEIGGLDDRFDGYGGEDTLLGARIEQLRPGGIRYAPGPVACDHDQHELSTLLRKFEHYGSTNLDRLVEAYPLSRANADLHADWVTGRWWKRCLGRLLFNPPLDWLARRLVTVAPYPSSNYVIRYLLGSAVLRGYRARLAAGRQKPAWDSDVRANRRSGHTSFSAGGR